ncbi:MAG: superfamily protein [Phycisphaerales bacterium]|nr:superfamily protein [Phycisphaerales bacterium]
MSRRSLILVALWLAAFAAGLAADRPVAKYAKDRGWDEKRTWTRTTVRTTETLKVPGTYLTVLATAALLATFHPAGWRAAALVAGSGVLSGANFLLKWIAGRRRPVTGIRPFEFDLFVGGLPGLFGAEKNLSFPSGHAALAFAAASALAVCLPRWRVAFYAVAAVVGLERIAENAHYVSDTVAGAAVGVASTYVALALCRRFIPKWDEGWPERPSPGPKRGSADVHAAPLLASANPQSEI